MTRMQQGIRYEKMLLALFWELATTTAATANCVATACICREWKAYNRRYHLSAIRMVSERFVFDDMCKIASHISLISSYDSVLQT